MPGPAVQTVDLILGRWRGQILDAGTALGVFDHLTGERDATAPELAHAIGADPNLLYHLLGALAAIGLLAENGNKEFRLSGAGALLLADHPHSLRAMAQLYRGAETSAAWKHLVAIVRDGRQNGFLREFGVRVREYASANPAFRSLFNEAMTSHSTVQTKWVIAPLHGLDFSAIRTVCDVGGGHGHLVCGLLQAYPHLTGVVFDRPQVVAESGLLWGPKLGRPSVAVT